MHIKDYKKLLFSSLGAAFEYYDFAIYSVFAVAIGKRFFDSSSAVSNTLLAFSVYAIGYLARPLGAWFFGHIADRKGRAFVLRLNMFLLFFSTLILTFLPSVQTVGVIATILFVVLRCIQAIAISAEIPVAVIFSIDNYPKRRGLVTSTVFSCLSLGIMMTTLVLFLLTRFFSDEVVQNYGWRIGFLIGAVFTFILFFLRRDIVDEPVNSKTIVDSDRGLTFIAKVIVGIMLVACISMLTTQLYMFLPSFYQMYVVSKIDIAKLLLIGSIIMTISCIVGGFISDYVSKQKLMAILVIISMFTAPILYRNIILDKDIYFCFILISIIMGFFSSTYNVIIVDFFSSDYRSRGYGISYNLAYLLFSSGVPALTILLITETNQLLIPAYLIIIAGVISLLGLGLCKALKIKKV